MHYIKNYILLFSVGILFSTCSKDKFEAQVPTYITIDKIDFTTNYSNEGSDSEAITDAWVYVNDNLEGVFELPATFPVLREGNVEIKVYAGIKDNGISATRSRYTMYDPYIINTKLVAGETLELTPEVSYNKSLQFRWLEDFESPSLSFLYHSSSDTTIFKQSNDVKEGTSSGGVFLDAGMNFFEATSVIFNNIPRSGTPVYLEMDFKTNEYVVIGIYHDQTQVSVLTLNVTDEWTKIYINLTDAISQRQSETDIKVSFGFLESASSPFLTNNPEVQIDNIKLLHY